ncbi:hypothetical protein REPUB_Repub15cG0118000 [Reevesia pubescens]
MYSASKIGSMIKKLGHHRHSSKPKKYSYTRLTEAEDAKAVEARRGYVPMYVGKEAKRYEVPIKYLSSPAFQELLIRSRDDDLETKIDGPISIACCTSQRFEQLLKEQRQRMSAWDRAEQQVDVGGEELGGITTGLHAIKPETGMLQMV